MADYYVALDGAVTKNKKKKRKADYSVSLDGTVTKNFREDTEVKTTPEAIGNSVFDNYKHYMDADDFEKQSQYKSTKSDAWHRGLTTQYGLGFEDITYEYINNVDGTREKINDKARTFGKDTGDNASSQEKKGYDRLREEEIAVYNYIYSTEGKKKAQEFLDSMETTLTKRVYDENTKAWKDATDNGTVASAILSAASVPANIIGTGQSAMESVADILQGKEYNPYGYYKTLSNFSADTRQYVGENIEESTEGMDVFGQNIPSFLYQTGMSVSDSVAGASMLGGGYSVLAGMSSANQRARELKEAGASSEEIARGAIATGAFEMIFEKFSLDNLIKAKDANTLAQMTKEVFKQAGVEASEEMATETANIIFDSLSRGKKSDVYTMYQEYLDSGLNEKEAKQKVALELGGQVAWAGAGGALSGATLGSAATLSGKKSANILTENEQKVLDKEVENRIAERETDGNKLSKKEKSAIKEQARKDLEKGYISIDTIESTLGGETYNKYKAITNQEGKLQKEIESLENMPNSQITVKQNERLQRARKELQALQQNSNKTQLKEQLFKEVQELTLNDKLSESYNEKSRRSQAFETDISKYDAKQQATIQKAIDSKILNNTNRTHEFVDMIAKISADKGVSFDFTNNENLKKSGFAIEGKSVNGFIKDGNITLNIQSAKALNKVVGHEITHVLEGSGLYTELQQAVKEYATTKGEYDSRYKALTELYKGVEGTNIENELTADLIGDYLFTDEKFVQQLSTQNRNVFQKIYNEIKYLVRTVTSGSKEAKQLEKVKKIFDEAYRDSSKAEVKDSAQFSLVGKDENGIEIYETSEDTKKLSYSERKAKLLDSMKNEYAGRTAKFTKNGKIYYALYNDTGIKKGVHGDKKSSPKGYRAKINIGADGNYIELAENSIYQGTSVEQGKNNRFHSNAKTWDYYVKTIQSDGIYFDVLINVKDTGNSQYVYDITLNEADSLPDASSASYTGSSPASDSSITKTEENATENQKKDYSLSLSNNDIAPIGNWNVKGSDLVLEGVPIRQDIAPAQQQDAAVDDIAPWTEETEDLSEGPFTPVEEDTVSTLGDEEELQMRESDTRRVKNIQANIQGFRASRDVSEKQFNESITKKQEEYDSLKRKDTLKASKLLTQINDLKVRKESALEEIDRKIKGQREAIDRIESQARARQRKSVQKVLREKMRALMGDTFTWKDKKTGFGYQTQTFKRNLRDTVRDANGNQDIAKADAIYEELQGAYNHHEAELNRESNRIKQEFRDMNITKEEDVYAQMLGEYRHNPECTLTPEVMQEYLEKNRKKIDTAKVDKIIERARTVYDSLYSRLNEVLRAQGMKEIGYHEGYFPHFTEESQNWLAKIFNWKVQNNNIPTDIAGLTEQFTPDRSWQSFNKHRTSDVTGYNFSKGLDTYVQGALDWIYHIEDIQKRRAFENEIRYQHSDKGVQELVDDVHNNPFYDADQMQEEIDRIYKNAKNPLNNFVQDLRKGTNVLAGKKDSSDRSMESRTNRQIYSTMTNISSRVSANMVAGSISSALTNFIPITQSWGQVSPISSLKAMKDTIKSIVMDDGMVAKSDFLTNRLQNSENLYKSGWDKASEKIGFLMEAVDGFTSQTVWRSKYAENLKSGMNETAAIKDADQFAENVMAGRSRGNMPTIFNEKNLVTRTLTAFQLEVANQYGYMFKDMPQDMRNESVGKLVKGYATMFLGAYAYNALYSSLTGRDAAFDPVGIIEELLRDFGFFGDDEEEEPVDAIASLATNIAEEIPFIGGLIGGGRIPISSALPYDGFSVDSFTEMMSDISKGDWKNVGMEWLNPVYYLLMPMGGGQLKKTVEGLSMFDNDLPIAGSYTNSGKLRYSVEDTPANRVQAALFGQYASKNAQEYFDEGRIPLSEKKTQELAELDIPISEYWDIQDGLKEQKKLADKVDYVAGLNLPTSKKNILANNLTTRKDPIDLTDYDLYGNLDELDFATKNPGKYKVAKVVGGYKVYDKYTKILNGIAGNKDSSGNTISGSRKQKVSNYINGLEIGYGEKLILFKQQFPSDNRYNSEIVKYLNERNDISYSDMETILKELGFTVEKDGTVRW